MRERVMTAIVLLGMVGCALPLDAQTTWSDHARISIDVGAQPSTSTFSATTSVPLYQQLSTLNTSYGVPSGTFFDGGVVIRVSGAFGIGVGASSFTKSQTASISGSIPHPLIFDRPRPIGGTSPPLERNEITGYIDASYVLSGPRVDVAISGGPAFFTVTQDLASNVTFTESPTNDAVAFTGAVVTRAMATNLGFNASADVGVKLSKNLGIGAIVRYARASVTFPLANTAAGVHADVGGMHAGGGLRIYF